MKNLKTGSIMATAVALTILVAASTSTTFATSTCGDFALDPTRSPSDRSASVGLSSTSQGGTPAPPKNSSSPVRLVINPTADCTWEDVGGNSEQEELENAVEALVDCIEDDIEGTIVPGSIFDVLKNGAADEIAFEVSHTFLSQSQLVPGIRVTEEDALINKIEIFVSEPPSPTGQPDRLFVNIPKFTQTPNSTGGEIILQFIGMESDGSYTHHDVSLGTVAGANMHDLLETHLIGLGFNVFDTASGLEIEDLPKNMGDTSGNFGPYLPIVCVSLAHTNSAMLTTDLIFEVRPQSAGGGGGGR